MDSASRVISAQVAYTCIPPVVKYGPLHAADGERTGTAIQQDFKIDVVRTLEGDTCCRHTIAGKDQFVPQNRTLPGTLLHQELGCIAFRAQLEVTDTRCPEIGAQKCLPLWSPCYQTLQYPIYHSHGGYRRLLAAGAASDKASPGRKGAPPEPKQIQHFD